MTKVFARLALMIFITSTHSAYAQAPASQTSPRPFHGNTQQVPDPGDTIRQGIKRIQAFLATDALANPAQVNAFLEREVAPGFDFTAMTQLILGPLNYSINDQQRRNVTIMVRKAFLKALAANLSNYRGGRVGNVRVTGNTNRGRVAARLAIYMPNQYPTVIELRIALGPKGWKIIDVSANGVSAVAHYRNFVRSVVQRSGFEGLLQ